VTINVFVIKYDVKMNGCLSP